MNVISAALHRRPQYGGGILASLRCAGRAVAGSGPVSASPVISSSPLRRSAMTAASSASTVPKLTFFRQVWGCELFSLEPAVLFPTLRELGYTGLEASIGDVKRLSDGRPESLIAALRANGLQLIAIAYTRWDDYAQWDDRSIEQQLQQYAQQLTTIRQWGDAVVHVNVHAGDDTWTMQQHFAFFEQALQLQERVLAGTDISVSYETHRGRSLSTPAVGLQLMDRFPNLRLTADLSHWLLVSERLFTHPRERAWMDRVAARVDHTHARVGYNQHAQIPHTSWPGYEKEIGWFDEWWQRIWHHSRQAGKTVIRLTPEIGPVPYTITNKDGTPVVDAWAFANSEKERIAALYDSWTAQQK